MKVLFSHSYFLAFDQKQLAQSKPYPPLGTIYAASYIREQGHEVALFDSNFSKGAQEVIPTLEQFKPEILVIYDDGFNYLTKMCLTNMRLATFEMIRIAKSKGIFVVVSSSDSTDHYTEYLKNGADIIIIGEAEESLNEIIQAKINNSNFSDLDGIVYLEPNGVTKSKARIVKKDLDELPFPAWDLVDIEKYKSAWKKHGYFSINIATTRGCPFKCNWCAKPIYGNRYNSHSPQYIVSLIQMMQKQFDFDHIWFCDDIFGLKPNWVQEFDKLLVQENITIRYKIQSRADLLLKPDTLQALASSGCDEIWIGAESGSQKILDAMDKGTQVEQIASATLGMKAHNIKPCFFLQFGYLGENWEDIQLTLNMVKELMPYDIGVSVSYPLPGTPFYEKVKDELKGKANWTDSDELLVMYKSTYQAKFYKYLHRYIHNLFRSKQAKEAIQEGFNPGQLLRFLYHSSKAQYGILRVRTSMKKDDL